MMKRIALVLASGLLASTSVYAQETPGAETLPQGPETGAAEPADLPESTPPAEPADGAADTGLPPEADAPADTTADASATTSVTDAEVESFAAATVKVQEINADASVPADQKQAQMAAAVREAGLDPARFNEIGEALNTDAELRNRVQTAMARHASPSEG